MSNPSETETQGPLKGVTVVDLSRLLPGPFASQLLCDLGATVIKVEDETSGGDYSRSFPPLAPDGNSIAFHALNRGKLSIVLNLKLTSDREQLLKLLEKRADVLIESFRPGVMAKLGLAPELLLKKFPRLIICSISGYGQTGPDKSRAGHDINYLARIGVLGMMRKPAVLPVQVADVSGGSWPAVTQILAALYARVQTGKGSIIDVSMAECAYSMMTMSQAQQMMNKSIKIGSGQDLLSGKVPCYDIYETKDKGYITCGALEVKFWSKLLKLLPGFTDEEREKFKTMGYATGKQGQMIRRRLQDIFASKTTEEWSVIFENADVMCEVVRSPDNIVRNNPHLKQRDVVLQVNIEGNTVELPKTPIRMTGVQYRTTQGPQLGQHTNQILSKL